MHVLRPHTHADDTRRDTAQRRKARHQPQRERRIDCLVRAKCAIDDPILDEDLEALDDTGGKSAPLLYAV